MALTSREWTPASPVGPREWAWLENTLGLIDPIEGEWLAARASEVRPHRAIVEIGSHTGLSTCWLAEGSRLGYGARVYAIDPWPDPGYSTSPGANDDPFDLRTGDAVYARFLENVRGTAQTVPNHDYSSLVTPWRMTSAAAAARWDGTPIGLCFVDAIHTFEGVRADVDLWANRVSAGGWLALNDYYADPDRTELSGAALVAKEILEPSRWWTDVDVVWNTWVGRRV